MGEQQPEQNLKTSVHTNLDRHEITLRFSYDDNCRKTEGHEQFDLIGVTYYSSSNCIKNMTKSNLVFCL